MANLRGAATDLSVDHYWQFDGDGTASVGGINLTEGGTVDFVSSTVYETSSGAVDFNSAHTNYLHSSTTAIAASATPFIMGALVRFVANAGELQVAMTIGHDEFSSGGGASLAVNNSTTRFQIGGSGLDGQTLTSGNWYLLIGQMDGTTSGTQWLYVGDVTAGTWTVTSTTIAGQNTVDASAETRFNSTVKTISQSNRDWFGDVDEAFVFDNVVYTESQIKTLWTGLTDEGVAADATAPGAGAYAAYSAAEAMVRRIVADGGTDTDQSLPASVATVLGVTNRGEVLANLQAAGATADSIPAAVNDLLSVENDWGEEDALRSLAEEYTAP